MNSPSSPNQLPEDLTETVRRALTEDLGSGDISSAGVQQEGDGSAVNSAC